MTTSLVSNLVLFFQKVFIYIAFVIVLRLAVLVVNKFGLKGKVFDLCAREKQISAERNNTSLDSSSSTAAQKNGPLLLVGCTLGLLFAYLSWGILQERIMTEDYDGEKFQSAQFLVLCNRLLALIVSGITLVTIKQPPFLAPAYKLCYPAFSNVMSSFSQYEALKFVTFPTQVIFKSSKLIPVILMGKLIANRKYPFFEYIIAFVISIGAAVFTMASSSKQKGAEETSFTGLVYLIGYISFDSFTSQYQKVLYDSYKLSPYQMMFGVNVFSSIFTFSSLSLSGELDEALTFLSAHPSASIHLFGISCCGAFGQLLIYFTIKRFGPLAFTMIMAVRQLLSTIISVYIHGHTISVAGYFGAFTVFSAVGIRLFLKYKAKVKKEKEQLSRGPQDRSIEEEKHLLARDELSDLEENENSEQINARKVIDPIGLRDSFDNSPGLRRTLSGKKLKREKEWRGSLT